LFVEAGSHAATSSFYQGVAPAILSISVQEAQSSFGVLLACPSLAADLELQLEQLSHRFHHLSQDNCPGQGLAFKPGCGELAVDLVLHALLVARVVAFGSCVRLAQDCQSGLLCDHFAIACSFWVVWLAWLCNCGLAFARSTRSKPTSTQSAAQAAPPWPDLRSNAVNGIHHDEIVPRTVASRPSVPRVCGDPAACHALLDRVAHHLCDPAPVELHLLGDVNFHRAPPPPLPIRQ